MELKDLNMVIAGLLEEKKFLLDIKEDELAHKEAVLNNWESRLKKRQDALEKHKIFLINYEIKIKEDRNKR